MSLKTSLLFIVVATLLLLSVVVHAQLLPKQFYEDAVDNAIKTNTIKSNLMGFSVSAATTMVRYSGAAYCARANANALTKWNCQTCRNTPTLTDVTVFAGSTARGFVGYEKSGNRIIVAFSGTPGKSIATWAANLDARNADYSKCSGCKVHKGFWDGYNGVKNVMMNAVKNLSNKYKAPIVCTGHSLGGAQCLFAIADIYTTSGLTLAKEHYTFGAPRTGNTKFASYITGLPITIYRLVNNADLVPHVPPSWSNIVSFGTVDYRHIAMEVFHRNGQYTTCSATDGEDSKCPSALIPVSVSDHLTYVGYEFGSDNPDCASGWKSAEADGKEDLIPLDIKMSDIYPNAAEVDAINMLRVVQIDA